MVGKLTQYPLRLAWAITIHKSQSLTFDKVAINLSRGSFTFGQTYVALSRARSIAGIDLMQHVNPNSIMVSKEILSFFIRTIPSAQEFHLLGTFVFVGFTTGMDFHQFPKIILCRAENFSPAQASLNISC